MFSRIILRNLICNNNSNSRRVAQQLMSSSAMSTSSQLTNYIKFLELVGNVKVSRKISLTFGKNVCELKKKKQLVHGHSRVKRFNLSLNASYIYYFYIYTIMTICDDCKNN